jgi:hypothetical protein
MRKRIARDAVKNLFKVISFTSGFQDVYGVSYRMQRRLQPKVRINSDGTALSRPSP